MRPSHRFAAFAAAAWLTLNGTLSAPAARASVLTPMVPAGARATFQPLHPDSAPLPESLAFLRWVSICPARGCDVVSRICQTDSIAVRLGGVFPDDCFRVRKIDLFYPPILSIRPTAPWVRVIVDDFACLGRPCAQVQTPWEGGITMPPLPEGPYSLDIAIIRVSCTDSIPPYPWPLQSFGFTVANCRDSLPPVGCILDDWQHVGPGYACDSPIGVGQPARLVFKLRTTQALAGLQGTFDIRPSGLMITDIVPIGPAAGWPIAWSATDVGADFVLLSTNGQTIPPTPDSLGYLEGAWPLLQLTLAQRVPLPIPRESRVFATSLLGATPDGQGLRLCPLRIGANGGLAPFFERFGLVCLRPECDFNTDGFTDVRDLVLMVHCVQPCPVCVAHPDLRCIAFDCNSDGITNIDDVLCCAWRILRMQGCTRPDGCPPDTTPARPNSGVRMSVAVPVEAAGETRVAIHVDGAELVGAARLALAFPADRWQIVALESSDTDWLTLFDAVQGQAIIGAIRVGTAPHPEGLDLVLRLRPLGGSAAGGELGALEAEVSGTDGVKLLVPLNAPARPLPGGATIALSENYPDPFTGGTRFTLSLPVATTVDLAVFDLGGRRIAQLHRGLVAAGVQEFAWNGRTDAGDRVGSGVYFYRLRAGGQSLSRRMVYLGSH